MNQDQARGKWAQIKGRAKRVWGALTDSEVKKAEGSVEMLSGTIRRKFGDLKAAVKAKINKLLS